MVNRIAIIGKARSGKNTVSDFIKSKYDAKIFAFADPIKEIVMTMYPQADRNCLWGPSELRSLQIPDTEWTYRELLLELGALGRKINSNTWINSTLSMIDRYLQDNKLAILSDVRFKNELQEIKKSGFITIKLVRPNNNYILDDISEKDLDDISDSNYDYLIVNDGSLEKLNMQVTEIVRQLAL